MKRLLFAGSVLLSVWACSSSDDSSTSDDVTAAAGGAGAAGSAVMTDASASNPMNEAAPPADHSVTTTGGDTGAPASDAKAPMSDAPKIVDAPEQVDAPMTCVKYCSCMAKWCADKIFATGCLVECTRQTNWDLPCRQNMCNLVEPQPNNDHCTHAFGKFQCTDN